MRRESRRRIVRVKQMKPSKNHKICIITFAGKIAGGQRVEDLNVTFIEHVVPSI